MTAGQTGIRLEGASMTFVSALPSKKNRVALVSIETPGERTIAVSKKHATPADALAERDRLISLYRDDIRVPRPYGCIQDTLYLEYMEGELIVDVVEQGRPKPERWCRELALWFRRFHALSSLMGNRLKGDVNLRNFILGSGDVVWGLDFEESPTGDPAVDIGRTMAFILSTRPHFAPGRREMCSFFLETYGTAGLLGDPWEECNKELRAMAVRRPAEREVIGRYLLEEQGGGRVWH